MLLQADKRGLVAAHDGPPIVLKHADQRPDSLRAQAHILIIPRAVRGCLALIKVSGG